MGKSTFSLVLIKHIPYSRKIFLNEILDEMLERKRGEVSKHITQTEFRHFISERISSMSYSFVLQWGTREGNRN